MIPNIFKFLGIRLPAVVMKLGVIGAMVAFVSLYPIWAMVSVALTLYLAATGTISSAAALVGVSVASVMQSIWLLRLRRNA